ncbi:hypothetical protein cyc_05791 [Cyclospora cayetanensis]|uniref:Transmembrane protein n=1 Tax=Cyclospora cayetanensis TaxID=88456 RepID=A0A1D3D7C9_9EIME|nr:hypothetical protein cyc_05791 [Cyclospora cayetanensis]
MVQEGDWVQADPPQGTDIANTRKDSWEGADAPDAETKVFVETSHMLDKGSSWLPYIIASFFLSFIVPPIGCAAFCLSLSAPAGSRRAVWGERALGVGSLLSFIYTLLLSMLLSEYYFIPKSGATLGYGY